MFKKILIISIMFLIISSLSFAQEPKNIFLENQIDDLIQETIAFKTIEKSTVNIMGLMPELENCTGVVIENKPNYASVLTCKHCIVPTQETMVENNHIISVIASATQDLALIIVQGYLENKSPAIISNSSIVIGETIYLFGKPGMATNIREKGTVLRHTETYAFAKLKAIPGCSGGGIFNEKLELVGILWGAYKEGREDEGGLFSVPIGGTMISVFEPIEDIHEFLNDK